MESTNNLDFFNNMHNRLGHPTGSGRGSAFISRARSTDIRNGILTTRSATARNTNATIRKRTPKEVLDMAIKKAKYASRLKRTYKKYGDFPHFVPGPAGSTFGLTSTAETNESTAAAMNVRGKNYTNTWHIFLHTFKIRPYGKNVMKTSITKMKNNALRDDQQEVNMAAWVVSKKEIGIYPSLVLEDATGTINATIIVEIQDEPAKSIHPGCVLMLQGVFAVHYSTGRNEGFHINLSKNFHMTIQSGNIKEIFDVNTELTFERKLVTKMYRKEALEGLIIDPKMWRKERLKVLSPENDGESGGEFHQE